MSRARLPSQASPRGPASRLRHWLATLWRAAAGRAAERALTLLKEHLSPRNAGSTSETGPSRSSADARAPATASTTVIR